MLVSGRVAHALEAKRETLHRTEARNTAARDHLLGIWDELMRLSVSELDSRLGGVPWPGARPTAEWAPGGIIPFERSWQTAPEARAWAIEVLRGVRTVAVDGSQIAPSREFGVPISLVQVGWFENPHAADTAYIKDVRNEVLAPDDPPEEVSEYVFAEARVNRSRFTLEMQVLGERLEVLNPDPTPVAFHDGSFVLSFAGRMPPSAREEYLQALFAVLDCSRRRRIPVVGYIDSSLAADVTTMLKTAADVEVSGVIDGMILEQRLGVFDRTVAFRCARGDILPYYRTESRDYAEDLCFVYLRPGREHAPARIDFPAWVLDAGLLNHVLDVIRAEIVVGSGYPYALETADATAVLTVEDRLDFYRQWHAFAQAAGLGAAMPAKTASKRRRR